MERVPLVDEILVVDDGSADDTAAVARAAGARVEASDALLPELGPGTGKGEAMWKGLSAAQGDIVVWCDADITNFGARFVTGLLGPLLTEPSVGFTKGFYDRPVAGTVGTGGRNTELVARPLIALLHPHLSGIVQPLSGEYGGPPRRSRSGPVRAGLRRRARTADRHLRPLRLGRHRPGRPRCARAPEPLAR